MIKFDIAWINGGGPKVSIRIFMAPWNRIKSIPIFSAIHFNFNQQADKKTLSGEAANVVEVVDPANICLA